MYSFPLVFYVKNPNNKVRLSLIFNSKIKIEKNVQFFWSICSVDGIDVIFFICVAFFVSQSMKMIEGRIVLDMSIENQLFFHSVILKLLIDFCQLLIPISNEKKIQKSICSFNVGENVFIFIIRSATIDHNRNRKSTNLSRSNSSR